MSSSKSSIYVHRKSKEGDDILCPIDEFEKQQSVVEDEPEECVEQDVVGRYAGNIEIRSRGKSTNNSN
jgi:hypothetical protein